MAERGKRTVRDLRRGNRASLLRLLYFEGPLSRQELGRDTGLSAGSISNVVGELIADGMVEEAGAVESDGGRPRMDLSLSDWSCRGFRFPWRGEPSARPVVAAQLAGTQTRLWASWNGSTQVAAWRVLAGPNASHLSASGPPSPKQGFETEVILGRRYADVAVQALGASGKVLATSRPAGTGARGVHR